jgi:hypothetical protein
VTTALGQQKAQPIKPLCLLLLCSHMVLQLPWCNPTDHLCLLLQESEHLRTANRHWIMERYV